MTRFSTPASDLRLHLEQVERHIATVQSQPNPHQRLLANLKRERAAVRRDLRYAEERDSK